MISLQGMEAVSFRQAALLIDADNFAEPQAIDAAWAEFKAYAGRINVCRAYGNVVSLQKLAPLWRTLGARTFPNLSLEKNTTDAALIADAVALHFQQEVRIFAIASGDADFAPLVVRLREWGCEVWCFSMEGILFSDAEGYYDRVVRFPPKPVIDMATAPVMPVAAPRMVMSPAPSRVVPVSMPPRESIQSLPVFPVLPKEVQRILKAVPGLRGAPQMLNHVVPLLRQKDILGKTTKSTVFFARHKEHFKLSPAHQPTQLTYTPATFTPSSPASHAAPPPAKPTQKLTKRSAVSIPEATTEILAWPVVIRRQATPPLLAELHGLRSVLLQLAVRRVSAADVLLATPEMLHGQSCALSAVAGRLREKHLLRPYQSALRILERHPVSFELQMNCKPPAVIYLR